MGGNERIEALRRALHEFRAAVRSPNRKNIVRDLLGEMQTNHTDEAHVDPTSHYFEKSRRALIDSFPEGQRGSRAPLIGALVAGFKLRAGRARSNVAALQTELVSQFSASFSGTVAAMLTVTLGVFSAPALAPAVHHGGSVVAAASNAVTQPKSDGVVDARVNKRPRGVSVSADVRPGSAFTAETWLNVRRTNEIRVERTITVHAAGDDHKAGGTVFWTSCDPDSVVLTTSCKAYDETFKSTS